jgi:hypothetical protein
MYGHSQSPPAPATKPRTSLSNCEADRARLSEWVPRPVGQLGRRLLADLEPYLEFFAIARAA